MGEETATHLSMIQLKPARPTTNNSLGLIGIEPSPHGGSTFPRLSNLNGCRLGGFRQSMHRAPAKRGALCAAAELVCQIVKL